MQPMVCFRERKAMNGATICIKQKEAVLEEK